MAAFSIIRLVFPPPTWHTYGMIWTKGQIQYYVDYSGQYLRHLHAQHADRHLALRFGSGVYPT